MPQLKPIAPEDSRALRDFLAGTHSRVGLVRVNLSCALSGTTETLTLTEAVRSGSGWEGLWQDGQVVPVSTAARRRILVDSLTSEPLEDGDTLAVEWYDGQDEHSAYLSAASLARLHAKIEEQTHESSAGPERPEILGVRSVGERASRWEFVKAVFARAKQNPDLAVQYAA